MGTFPRAAVLVATLACVAVPSGAQDTGAERAYFSAVARFFQLPESEIQILGDWNIPPDEIPVVLFVARRSGVSPEALVALRESGRSWTSLAARYGIGASVLHVPLRDIGAAGALTPLYERFRDTPVGQWGSLPLDDQDIVALVNVRVLSQSLGLASDEIARRTRASSSFVELYARLLR